MTTVNKYCRPNSDAYKGMDPSSGSTDWEMIDDVVADDDGTYLSNIHNPGYAVAVNIDAPDIPLDATDIVVTIGMRVKNGQFQLQGNFSGGDINGTVTTVTDWQTVEDVFYTNPWDSNNPWTPGNVNLMNALGTIVYPVVGGEMITQEYALISYTSAGGGSHTLTYGVGSTHGCSIVGDTPQTVADGDDGTAVSAIFTQTDGGYHYAGLFWSDNHILPPDPAPTVGRVDYNVTGDITVSAVYGRFFVLTYNFGTGGTIDGIATQLIWKEDVTEGYGSDTKEDVGDVADIVVYGTAGFDYSGGVKVYGTEVTAVPNSGYHFVQWSDDVMTASRTDADPTADGSVTAIFAPDAASFVPQIWEY